MVPAKLQRHRQLRLLHIPSVPRNPVGHRRELRAQPVGIRGGPRAVLSDGAVPGPADSACRQLPASRGAAQRRPPLAHGARIPRMADPTPGPNRGLAGDPEQPWIPRGLPLGRRRLGAGGLPDGTVVADIPCRLASGQLEPKATPSSAGLRRWGSPMPGSNDIEKDLGAAVSLACHAQSAYIRTIQRDEMAARSECSYVLMRRLPSGE